MTPKSRLQDKIFLWLLTLATLTVVPWMAVEPISTIKFQFVVVIGFFAASLIFSNLKIVIAKMRYQKILAVSTTCFALAILSSLLTSQADWRQQIYGVGGRNIGILTYISILLLFLYITFLSDHQFDLIVLQTLLFCGSASTIYGILQFVTLDPINWNNKYNAQIGFLGNPNFHSAFLGIYSILLLNILTTRRKKLYLNIILLLNLSINVFLIFESDSIQGIFVFFVGATVLMIEKLYQSKARALVIPASTIASIIGISAMFGLLQKGPLAFLYQPSISFRGDYWRAGEQMFRDNPFFGVGISSFGNFYRAYRDAPALERRLDGSITNSAHNIFIDLAAEGGIFALGSFLVLVSYTLIVFLKTYKRDAPGKTNFVIFFALWLGYLSQAMISVSFISLLLFGWIFMAIILRIGIGIPVQSQVTRTPTAKRKENNHVRTPKNQKFFQLVSVITGVLIGVLPLKASVAEKSAYDSRDFDTIVEAASVELKDSRRILTIALILLNNGYKNESLVLAKESTRLNKQDYEAWKLVAYLSPDYSNDKITANLRMKELDPQFFKANK